MKRKPSSKSQSPAVAMLSASVFLTSGASAQATRPQPPKPQSPASQPLGQAAPRALPAVQSPAAGREAAAYTIKFAGTFMKWRGSLSVAGMLNGRPVFKTPQGEYFQVEPNTGDLQFHSAESLGYIKLAPAPGRAMAPGQAMAPGRAGYLKFDGIKGEQRVSVAGVDAQGRVIQENARGERFYLNPMGDMVFVK
ncbi:hypothetical protein [Geothrix paludis]|uniref:hypothetical protein n=1 Tax=Geothrix paludis TaxID=2922722 RepID=UPI001FAB62AA|nr:hypothetical protein [Geothrix paludis]